MCGGQNIDVDIKLSSKGSATGRFKYGGLCAAATATFTARIG